MNAIDLLESQHHDIEALFEKLLSAASREMKERFLLRLADSLAIHASIEEHHLFPAARQKRVPESIEEHLAIRRVLGDPEVRSFELFVLAKLFGQDWNVNMRLLSEVRRDYDNVFPPIRDEIYRTLVKAGMFATSPERVPITRPSIGVMPIEVSTARPAAIADAEAPLPRCNTIWFSDSGVTPR